MKHPISTLFLPGSHNFRSHFRAVLALAAGLFLGTPLKSWAAPIGPGIVFGDPAFLFSGESGDVTTDLAWGDMDADGFMDLAVTTWNGPCRIYRFKGPTLTHP